MGKEDVGCRWYLDICFNEGAFGEVFPLRTVY